VDAPPIEKEKLLKDQGEFSFRGIPESKNGTINDIITSSAEFSGDLEERILVRRAEQKVLMTQLKEGLKVLRKYVDSATNSVDLQRTSKTVTNKNVGDLEIVCVHLLVLYLLTWLK
jgi:hypothetical protein